jgi:hypothetical protein
VFVVVPVGVMVGVWLGVTEPVGGNCVKVVMAVCVEKTTGVRDEVTVGVTEVCPDLGARSAATSPAQ